MVIIKEKLVSRVLPVALALAALGIGLACCPRAEDGPTGDRAAVEQAHKIAKTYGLEGLQKVEALRFTFNIRKNGVVVSRAWTWNRLSNEVTLKFTRGGKTSEYAFNHRHVYRHGTKAQKKLDGLFINDTYWLLFPFRLVESKKVHLKLTENSKYPISGAPAKKLTIRYGSGGYTPGDAYDVYFGGDNILKEWSFRKGGKVETGRLATWEKTRDIGPIKIALEHNGPDKNFRLWFTDVAVKLREGKKWISAK